MSRIDRADRSQIILSSRWLARPWVRFAALTIYYLGILVGLIALYGRGDFSTPPFIYQNF
jgi:D-Ala-teichoic acid biosynthesis protein